jgi:hypothetical protein
MILHSLKIVGTGAAVPLSSGTPAISGYVSPNPLQAKWVQVATIGNAANVNIGGNEVVAPTVSPATAGTGFPIPPGISGQLLPPVAEHMNFYDLSDIYAGIATGDALYILYGG